MKGFRVKFSMLLMLSGLVSCNDQKVTSKTVSPQLAENLPADLKTLARASGLDVELVASEPLLANPVAFDIDGEGKIYVAESYRIFHGVTDMRRHPDWLADDLANRTIQDRLETMRRVLGKEFASYRGVSEQIRLLQDSNGDGVYERSQIFASGFDDYLSGLGAGVLADGKSVYYACIPDLWRLQDLDGDGDADWREQLSTGYGVRFGFYGHDLHGLLKGPDGKLYFSIGDRGLHVETPTGVVAVPDEGAVLRCNLDGSDLEVVHRGLRNPQELAFDDFGNLFTGDNNADGGDLARLVQIVEGGDSGWRVGYQYLSEPVSRGPWNLERLWLTRFEGQAAYLLPPLAHIGAGPAGIAYYPGTGLPDRYQRHFFLADFRGNGTSLIHSFELEPQGASFRLRERRDFSTGAAFTDVGFGPRPGLFASDWGGGWTPRGLGRLYRYFDPGLESGAGSDTGDLLAVDFDGLDGFRLRSLLAHPDQRVRLSAQFSLAKRGEQGLTIFRNTCMQSQSRLARIHAVWGLGQLAETLPGAASQLRRLLRDRDLEVQAQAIKALGRIRDPGAISDLLRILKEKNVPLKASAALALGRIGSEKAVTPLLTMARETGGGDPYLRHAAVMGLVGSARPAQLLDLVSHPSSAVRLVAVLALRRLQDPGVAGFLKDKDLSIVAEAARAIYDVPIEAGLGGLADLVGGRRFALLSSPRVPGREELFAFEDSTVVESDDRLLKHELPILLRSMYANWRLGEEQNAMALARVAASGQAHWLLRSQAVRLLSLWDCDETLDPFLGIFRPAPAHDPEPARTAALDLREVVLNSVQDDLVRAGIELIQHFQVEQAAPLLERLVRSQTHEGTTRAAALETLADLDSAGTLELVEMSTTSADPVLRRTALETLGRLAPAALEAKMVDILRLGSAPEKQSVLHAIDQLDAESARPVLSDLMDQLLKNKVEAPIQLDVLQAAKKLEFPEIQEKVNRFEKQAESASDLGLYDLTLWGGDAERGEKIFATAFADCQRCHRANGLGGGTIGPDLSGLAERLSRREIVESIVYPNRRIATGYETVDIILQDGRDVSGRVVREDEKELVVERDISYLVPQGEDDVSEGEDAQLPHSQVDSVAESEPEDPARERVEIRKSDIRSRRTSQSAMPENAVEALTLDQVRDLVAFLGRGAFP